MEKANVSNQRKGEKGYVNLPLIHIEFNKCTIDPLHLLLRGTEKLFEILETFIMENDVTFNGSVLTERPMFEKYLNFLSSDCQISNAYYTNKQEAEKDNIRLRSFNSNENEKIYKTLFSITGETNYGITSWRTVLDLQSLEQIEKIKSIDAIWKYFHKIYQVVKNRK